MSSTLQFEECDTPAKMEALRLFALTMEPPHEVVPSANRFLMVRRNGIAIGYSEIVKPPIVFTAWHHSFCEPKDIYDAMKYFVGWAKIQYGEGYTTVPLDTRTFPEKIMNKLGFFRLGVEIYKAK